MMKGFSLVEVLLAAMISSLLMVAASIILVNYSELYLSEQTRPSYEQHASNVTQFLEQTLSKAASVKLNTNTGGTPGTPPPPATPATTPSLDFGPLPESSSDDEKYLNFENTQALPVIHWEEGGALPLMRVYLYFEEGEGLFFIWQTKEQANEDPKDMQISMISPFVKAMRYQYYDEEGDAWEEELSFLDEDKQSQRKLPDMVKLDFEWPDERKMTTSILLPANLTGAPLY